MNQLKCMGEKCPNYEEHEFRSSYFMCWLDGVSFKKDYFRDRNCCIYGIIKGKHCELESLKELASDIKEENK